MSAKKAPHVRLARPEDRLSSPSYRWAKGFDKALLQKQFLAHGEDMGTETEQEYEAVAVLFANIIRNNRWLFVDGNSRTFKYDPDTRRLVIVDKRGYVLSFYKVDHMFVFKDMAGDVVLVKNP